MTKHLKLTAGLRGCSGSGPSPGAAGCAERVEGHLYPRRLCPDLGGGGVHVGLPTGWTDFLCRVMPRTGFRDKGVGPQTETLTGRVCYHSLSFLIRAALFP